MAKIPERLKQIFQELQLEPQDAVWDCHGTPVAYHKALEQVAEHLKIVFDLPTIIDASAEKNTRQFWSLAGWEIALNGPWVKLPATTTRTAIRLRWQRNAQKIA